MSEEKRFDEFELDMDELESVAGGEISAKLEFEIMRKLFAKRDEEKGKILREIEIKEREFFQNVYKDIVNFRKKEGDVPEEEIKKYFSEKYGISF